MADIIEKLGLDTEVRELKLGSSFTNGGSSVFHTLKYDFKPASVDESKMATVDVGSNNTMTVTVPHLDGAGTPQTVFKGSHKPYQKECVLIIDHITGEITLEKLSSNIQVKKTRAETKSQAHLAMDKPSVSSRPITPVEKPKSPTHGRTSSRTKVVSGKKKEPTFEVPGKKIPSRSPSSHMMKASPPIVRNNSPPVYQPTAASLPMIGMDADDFGMVPIVPVAAPVPPPATQSAPRTSLPRKSPPVPVKQQKVKILENDSNLSDSSSSSSSSDSSDSSDNESETLSKSKAGVVSSAIMPKDLLNDDLQLSESESDSD